MSKPFIDLILLSYGKFSTTTKPCLDSLLTDCTNDLFRLTVIDNCSPDESANEIRAYLHKFPYVRAEFLSTNTGFAGGMNYGASIADAEWLLLVNSDTIFAPGALMALAKTLQTQPEVVGMVGPITNAAGNGQDYKIPGTAAEVLAEATSLQDTPCNAAIPAYRLDFFCVAVRKSLWDKLGGLDPVFGLGYYEDTDFSMRAHNFGSTFRICEDAFVYHVGGSSFSTNPATRKLIKRNKKLFLSRHPSARLLHKREANLEAIEEYIKLRQAGQWNAGLALRLEYRLRALQSDMPRSLMKRLLWKWKIKKVISTIK